MHARLEEERRAAHVSQPRTLDLVGEAEASLQVVRRRLQQRERLLPLLRGDVALCGEVAECRALAEKGAGEQCVRGPAVLAARVQEGGVGGEVVRVARGEREGLVCPEYGGGEELLVGVLLGQGASFLQQGHPVSDVGRLTALE